MCFKSVCVCAPGQMDRLYIFGVVSRINFGNVNFFEKVISLRGKPTSNFIQSGLSAGLVSALLFFPIFFFF